MVICFNVYRYIEKNWNLEEFSGGCYGGIMPPGLLSRCSELLLKPLGRLHFAGTETSTSWTGYMEGAVQVCYTGISIPY